MRKAISIAIPMIVGALTFVIIQKSLSLKQTKLATYDKHLFSIQYEWTII